MKEAHKPGRPWEFRGPSVPLHSRPHGHCLLQLEPLGLGLEVGLGFTPLSCLRSSGEEVPQARAPPTLREDQAP